MSLQEIEEGYVREPVDIHLWFGLTYSNYLVLHRSILQSAPEEWQHRFTALLDELRGMMGDGMQDRMPSNYDIRVLARSQERITEYAECDQCDGEGTIPDPEGTVYAGTGETAEIDCPKCDGAKVDYEQEIDTRFETAEEVGVIDDPIAHYNRGRTVIDFETGEESRYCNICKGRHTWSQECPDAAEAQESQ